MTIHLNWYTLKIVQTLPLFHIYMFARYKCEIQKIWTMIVYIINIIYIKMILSSPNPLGYADRVVQATVTCIHCCHCEGKNRKWLFFQVREIYDCSTKIGKDLKTGNGYGSLQEILILLMEKEYTCRKDNPYTVSCSLFLRCALLRLNGKFTLNLCEVHFKTLKSWYKLLLHDK